MTVFACVRIYSHVACNVTAFETCVCTRRDGCRVLGTSGACRCFVFLADHVDS